MPIESLAPLILAIEDDAAIRAVYTDLFADEGFRLVTWAEVPADGTAAVARLAPDLIMLDLVIGGRVAGWTMLTALHHDPETTDIPVLILTAAGTLIRERMGEIDAWGCGVLMKPFDLDELMTAVQECLTQGRDRAAS